MDFRQDSITKRKPFLRSDATLADEDNKTEMIRKRETHELRRSSVASNSKDSIGVDSSGVDILRFIEDTLHKNSKDREFLMETERKMRELLTDESQPFLVFPSLSSYNRMLVHRVAAFFGLLHNVDQSGQKVVVTKLPGTKLPETEFEHLIKHNDFYDLNSTRRSGQSFDETKGRRYPMRDFRNRFNTTAGEGNNSGELARNRRARSFEIDSDWYANFPRQQLALHRYSTTTIDYADGANSNCSSSASSTAISAQMHPLHLPLLQPTYTNSSTEASMISPASAYSEPAATSVRHQTVPFANHQSQIARKSVVTDSPPSDVCAASFPSSAKDAQEQQLPRAAVRPPSLFAVQANASPSQLFAHPSQMVGFRQQTVPPFAFSNPATALLSPTATVGPNCCYPPGTPFLYYPTSSGVAFYPASASGYPSFAQSFPPMRENGQNSLIGQFGRIVLTENNGQTEAEHLLAPTQNESQLTSEGTIASKARQNGGGIAVSQSNVSS